MNAVVLLNFHNANVTINNVLKQFNIETMVNGTRSGEFSMNVYTVNIDRRAVVPVDNRNVDAQRNLDDNFRVQVRPEADIDRRVIEVPKVCVYM